MPITVVCNGCGKQYRVADQAAGKKLRCRACGQDMLVTRGGGAAAASQAAPQGSSRGGEEDPFEALVAMEQKAAPAARQGPLMRGPPAMAPAEPMDVDDEPSRPKEKRRRPPGRFGRRSSGGIGTDNITPWLVIAFLAAQLAAAVLQTVQASHVPAQAHGKVVGVVWTAGILHIVLLFALLGPAVFLGVFISSKVLNYRLVDLGYLRGCAIGALPGLLLLAAALIPNGMVPQSLMDTVLTIGLWLMIPVTFLILRFVFDLDWVGAAVAYLFAAPLYYAAAILSTGVVTAAVLTQLFGSASAPPTHFYDRGEFARVTPSMISAPVTDEHKTPASPASTESDIAAKKNQTEQNLHEIGQAIQRFASGGASNQFPPTLETLVTAGDLPPERLNSPFQPSKKGGYSYAPGRTPAMPGNVVVAYDEAEKASQQGGTHVLFVNGNVEWRDAAQLSTTIAQSDQALGDWQTAQREAERKRQEEMIAKQATPATPEKPVEAPAVPKPQGFVATFNAAKSPLVASVAALPIEGDDHAIVDTATPSPWALVVRTTGGTQDQVEIWNLIEGQKKADATFAHEAGFKTSYAINAAGTLLARIVNFPKLEVRIWSVKEEKEARAIPLDEKLGTATLAGFLDGERLVVRWTGQRGLEGLEIWNVVSGRNVRRVPLQPYVRSVNNGVFSPDGREYAFTTSKIPPRNPLLGKVASAEFYDLVSSVNPRRPRQITEVAVEDVDTPAGMVFAPDGKRLAALYVKQGLGVIVIWRTSDTKPLGSYEVAVAPDAAPAAAGAAAAGPGLAWVHNGAALLVQGNTLVDANTGKTLGLLNAPPSTGQRALANDTLAYTYEEDGKSRVAVVKLEGSNATGSTTAPAEAGKH